MFLLVLGFTALYAVRTVRDAIYWRNHRDEPIRGWMNVSYVAHSYSVPPHVLYEALGLPHKPRDKRPLLELSRSQHRSMNQIRAILEDAIIHARPPYPPPPPPPPDEGGPP